MPYIARTLEPVLHKAALEFPAVVLTGARQCGKTTLLQHLFGNTHRYVSMETPDVRAAALSDPRGFLEAAGTPLIVDEVQYAPDLLPYIKEKIDAHRSLHGQYLLTGSQHPLLAERVSESLAGRAAVLRLMPLSVPELAGQAKTEFVWQRGAEAVVPMQFSYRAIWQQLVRGFYPELAAEPDRDAWLWHAGYVQTYLERDVRSLRQVGDLTSFQAFLRSVAARSGQLLNISDVARDLGVSVNTAKAWLSVLEATFQVAIIRPYFANIGKRLVKTPKVYFTDTGTLCYLTGLRDPAHAAAGPLAGAIFETAVVGEIVKRLAARGGEAGVYFWRTAAGAEVDFLVEDSGRLIPIEVKTTATPLPSMGDAIRQLRRELGDLAAPGFVIHPGDIRLPLGSGVTAVPFAAL